jgi:hypothetical protein
MLLVLLLLLLLLLFSCCCCADPAWHGCGLAVASHGMAWLFSAHLWLHPWLACLLLRVSEVSLAFGTTLIDRKGVSVLRTPQ